MKKAIVLWITLYSTLSVVAQKTVVADTFTYRQKFSYKQIILRSDSTFTLREISCTSSQLYMGFWQRAADTFLLSCLYNTHVSTRSDIAQKEISTSVPIQFLVTDCYGNPLNDYGISFYKHNLSYDTTYYTDQNGSFYITRDQYALYSTESDEANIDYQYQNDNNMLRRSIANNVKQVHIIIGYPKESVKENILLHQYYRLQSEKFVLKQNQLIEPRPNRSIIYTSKRPVLLGYHSPL